MGSQCVAEPYRVCLVSKKVNLFELCEVNETEAEGLVPAVGEHVEADLATDGELEPKVGELLLQHSHKRLSHLVHLPRSQQQVHMRRGIYKEKIRLRQEWK